MQILKQHYAPKQGDSEIASFRGAVLVLTDDPGRYSGEDLDVIGVCAKRTDFDPISEAIRPSTDAQAVIIDLAFSGNHDKAQDVEKHLLVYAEIFRILAAAGTQISLLMLSEDAGPAWHAAHAMAMSFAKETTRVKIRGLQISGERPGSVRALIAEAFSCLEPLLRYDRGRLLVRRFDAIPSVSSDPIALRRRGCYLITGGSGGVGRLLALWLREQYDAKVIVIGRSKMNPRLKEILKSAGAQSYLSADITDSAAVSQALAYIREKHGELDAAFHFAGSLDDQLLRTKTNSQILQCLAPKIRGLLNIQSEIGDRCPVICASSVSGSIGNIGQTDYAAGNAFMDAWCRAQNRFNGRRQFISIAWGLWQSEGMQMDPERGIGPMKAEEALRALRAVLSSDCDTALIYAGTLDLIQPRMALTEANTGQDNCNPERYDAVCAWLSQQVFRYAKVKDLDPAESLLDHGVDSVGLINIATAIESFLNKADPEFRLNKGIIFDYPSIGALAQHLLDDHTGAVTAAFGAGSSKAATHTEIAGPSNTEKPILSSGAVNDWLRALIERFSGIKSVGDEDNLIDLGVNSVTSINICTEIERQLSAVESTDISRSLLFDYSRIFDLSRYLQANHLDALNGVLMAVPASVPPETSIVTSEPQKEDPKETREETDIELGHQYREDDIAIVGIAGEFPDADSMAELCEILSTGKCAVRPVPESRWDWRSDYSPSRKSSGKSYARHGGFVRRAKSFDPGFFNIAPVDAEKIDPQERRLLQTSYHALEDSGFFAQPDVSTGVFVAAMFGHYQELNHPTEVIDSSFSSIANRISYSFDFRGPSIAIDTMCSGSLTAFHLACQSIKLGECGQAIVGAVNLMTHPGKYRLLSEGQFLSPTGRCHSFGAEADGYAPGEGAIALILKRVSDAQASGDRIYAIVRGSAVNSGGRSGGFTVPSARAQQAVIERAREAADIEYGQISYLEAHGTGTSLGDPIELQGLSAAFGNSDDSKCLLGAIKSNIGHLESAAGLAGVSKVLLQLKHERIFPTLHCEIENPFLNIEKTRFRLAKKSQDWPARGPLRYAGVSSFGAGGSNGHVILQEHRADTPVQPTLPVYVFPVSARTPHALTRKLELLASYVEVLSDDDLYALGYTLACCRQHFEHRACFATQSRTELLGNIREFLAGSQPSGDRQPQQVSYMRGEKVDFSALYSVKAPISAPFYPFSEREYWSQAMTDFPRTEPPAAKGADVVSEACKKVYLAPCWVRSERNTAPVRESCWVLCDSVTAKRLESVLPPTAELLIVGPGDDRGQSIGLHDVAAVSSKMRSAFADLTKVNLINLIDPGIFDDESRYIEGLYNLAKGLLSCRVRINLLHVSRASNSTESSLALHGLFRVLAMEHEPLCAGLAVIDGQIPETRCEFDELLNDTAGLDKQFKRIKYCEGSRFEGQFEEVSAGLSPTARLKQGGVYIISGGLGMIGQALAERLIVGWNATVVLLGRSPLDDSKTRLLDVLSNKGGGAALYLSVDITDAPMLNETVAEIRSRFGAIHGVIHAAGILRDSLLSNKSWDEFHEVMNVKCQGTRNLDSATADDALEIFALFSSLSSLLGNVGQADYVSANCFLDEFAAHRQERVNLGHRSGYTVSINWPLWIEDESDKGPMAKYRSLSEYLFKTFGLQPLTFDEGVQTFFEILALPDTVQQVLPARGDRARLLEAFTQPAESKQAIEPSEADPAWPIDGLADVVSGLICSLTRIPEDELDRDMSLGDLGLNSVLLQELSNAIEEKFGIAMPASALFNYNTADKLAAYIAAEVPEASYFGPSVGGAKTSASDRSIAEYESDDCYAIIGMDGRLPGGNDLDTFWESLLKNRSAIGRVDRWSGEYYAGTIQEIDHFDPKFFGLSAREAVLMDPQHRLFLQSSYNAMLDAGYAPKTLSSVGVFAGVQFNDYQGLLQQWDQSIHPYAATGNAHAMLANRVSYLMDFEGPSQTIDTACSSALVAFHRGVLALERGECEYSIVGAVSLMIDPVITDAAQSMQVLSENHRCATFDASADGYVRAEGVGCLILKPYRKALSDGDSIHAVVRSTAENHGGRANSLTAPNPNAQKRLLLSAYSRELAKQVSYIETHGTGTKLGDPIEVDALKSAWSELTDYGQESKVALGAVKSNIGHLEPAAGIASLMKVLLAMRHKKIPANINLTSVNPLISLSNSPFEILTENCDWNPIGPRVAGISSFGFGGSNAHVVLAEAPVRNQVLPELAKPAYLVTLSARTKRSLTEMRKALWRWLSQFDGVEGDIQRVAFTLNAGRDHFEYRHAWIVESIDQLCQYLTRDTRAESVRPSAKSEDLPSLEQSFEEYRGKLAKWRESYLAGYTLNWAELHAGELKQRLNLPGYFFDTQSYWFSTDTERGAKRA